MGGAGEKLDPLGRQRGILCRANCRGQRKSALGFLPSIRQALAKVEKEDEQECSKGEGGCMELPYLYSLL